MTGPRDWSPRGREGMIFSLENRGVKRFPGAINRILRLLTPEFQDVDGKKLYRLDDVIAAMEDMRVKEFKETFENYIRELHEENPDLRGSIYVTF